MSTQRFLRAFLATTAMVCVACGSSGSANDGGAVVEPADGGAQVEDSGGALGIDGGGEAAAVDGGAHDARDGGSARDGGVRRDGGNAAADGGASNDGGGVAPSDGGQDDGTPTRRACTSSFGSALTASYGRLDGRLVSIVPSGQHGCNEDADHVHLQIELGGAAHDVAITIRSQTHGDTVGLHEVDAPLLGGVWQEGWHTGARLDFPSMLGVHSGDFIDRTPAALAAIVDSRLGGVNHVSIFATGYGPAGAHLVHRNGHDVDGALVLHPTGTTPHYLLFRFSNQTF